jgi:hypothetical protein
MLVVVIFLYLLCEVMKTINGNIVSGNTFENFPEPQMFGKLKTLTASSRKALQDNIL